jgi:hypothetical protein
MSLRNAWRAVAAVPLMIVMVLGCVQLIGTLAPTQAPSSASADVRERVGSVADTRQVTAADRPKARKKKPAEKPSPSATPSPTSPSSPQTSDPTAPPKTSQPQPTRTPSPSPSAPGTPSDSPTPEEARDMCERAGVNPLDLVAMAACISQKMGD